MFDTKSSALTGSHQTLWRALCDFAAIVRQDALRFFSVLMLGLLVTACAAVPDSSDPEAVAEYQEINDPLEPFNRAMFELNRGLDTLILRPAATLYRGFVPPPIQDIVNNFLNNLKAPVVLLNDVLQGEGDRAMKTLSRFAINTTVGVLGFGDPATKLGYPAHKEDFGQTLATWGVDGGPYLVLPILGPSNPRDAVGRVVDTLTDPIWHYAQNTDKEYITNGRMVAEVVNFRARNLEAIDDLERTSLDYYAAVRTLYRQVRDDEIRNGTMPKTGLPAISSNGTHDAGRYSMGSMQDPDAVDAALATKN
jgi:phospholipid-binding lipoprotein MlaA